MGKKQHPCAGLVRSPIDGNCQECEKGCTDRLEKWLGEQGHVKPCHLSLFLELAKEMNDISTL